MHFELSAKQYEKTLTIDEAILYCFSQTIDGKSGWRLPTIDELHELGRGDFDIDGNVWTNVVEDDHGCVFHFDVGGIVTLAPSIDFKATARPVRST